MYVAYSDVKCWCGRMLSEATLSDGLRGYDKDNQSWFYPHGIVCVVAKYLQKKAEVNQVKDVST